MRNANSRDHLKLSANDMREMGYRIIDMLVDYTGAQAQFPVTRALDHATFEEILNEPLPEDRTDWQDVLEQFERQVLTTIDHLDHPRFFAYIPSSSNFVGAMADALASGYNIFNALYPLGAGAASESLHDDAIFAECAAASAAAVVVVADDERRCAADGACIDAGDLPGHDDRRQSRRSLFQAAVEQSGSGGLGGDRAECDFLMEIVGCRNARNKQNLATEDTEKKEDTE